MSTAANEPHKSTQADENGTGQTAAPPSGSSGIRVVVDRVDRPLCGIKVGDYFEVHDSALTIPSGKKFCPYAMAAVFPVLMRRQMDLPANDWLERKPWISCPDPVENVVMRLDRIDALVQP